MDLKIVLRPTETTGKCWSRIHWIPTRSMNKKSHPDRDGFKKQKNKEPEGSKFTYRLLRLRQENPAWSV